MPHPTASVVIPEKHVLWTVVLFLLLGCLLAYVDNELRLNTLLL